MENNNVIQKQQKKRGRPRKTALLQKPKSNEKKKIITHEKDIILHLPLFNVKKKSEDNNNFTEAKDYTEFNDDENFNSEENINLLSLSEEDNGSDESDYVRELKKELKNKSIYVKKLEDQIKKYRGENLTIKEKDINYKPIKLNMIDIKSNKSVVVDKTNLACWWCTHEFDTIPCFLPERYYDDTFYVTGCFCSFNCVLSYNLNMNDYKTMERYSLINKYYELIYENDDKKKLEDLVLAPPREILQKFGGPITIEDYRKNLKICKKEWKIKIPPLMNIVPFLEEKSMDKKVEITEVYSEDSYTNTKDDNNIFKNMESYD